MDVVASDVLASFGAQHASVGQFIKALHGGAM